MAPSVNNNQNLKIEGKNGVSKEASLRENRRPKS